VCVTALVSSTGSVSLAMLFAFLSGFFIVGVGGAFATIIAENLPLTVRASGVGFLYNIGVFGGGVAPYVVLGSLKAMNIGTGTGIALFTAIGVACTLIVIFAGVRETKGLGLTRSFSAPNERGQP
jgi:SHS family sialic acid transporter-like MFS transporter